MNASLILFILLLVAATWFSLSKRKLTLPATVTAVMLAVIVYSTTELKGIALMGSFFVLGIAVTWWNRKQQMFSVGEDEQRDALQVIANGGMAALLALLVPVFPDFEMVLLLMIASAFSSAAADTVSSELGTIYGRKAFDILTLKPAAKGDNGVISLEGTLLGIAASAIIAAVYFVLIDSSVTAFIVIIIAGTAGNLADSLLGATLERKNIIGNNAVNLLNTFIAAAVGGALIY